MSSLVHRRRELKMAFLQGGTARLDRELNLASANPVDDLRAMLALAPTRNLHSLAAALEQDRVVRGVYRGRSGSPCLVGYLFSIDSNDSLYDHPSATDAVIRCIRFWDTELLSKETVLRIVAETISARAPYYTLNERSPNDATEILTLKRPA
jgi:hypothetical protein